MQDISHLLRYNSGVIKRQEKEIMPKILHNEAHRLDRRLTFNTTREQEIKLRELALEMNQPFGTLLRAMLSDYLKADRRSWTDD